jgi:hypothetical protein
LLITLQWGPKTEPIRSPKNNIHKRVSFDIVKISVIPAAPDGPAHGSNLNPDHISKLFILITKPCTKHIVNRSRWSSTSSKENNPPNHLGESAINE